MSGAKLSRANLAGANLREASLWEATLQDAKLNGATLIRADLKGADLFEADLTRADLHRANCLGANFMVATLREAKLDEADFNLADMRAADITEATFRASDNVLFNWSRANSALSSPQEAKETTTKSGLLKRLLGRLMTAKPSDKEPLEYFEVKMPLGDGSCSDDNCPCGLPGASIPHGTGFLYIPQDVVDFRKDAFSIVDAENKIAAMKEALEINLTFTPGTVIPILICEEGARKRGIDLEVASADAKLAWETNKAPLRATPLASVP